MYLETRDSLNMVNPIAYFGYVKRDDILMCVQSSQKEFTKYSREYIKTKFEIMGKRLTSFDRKKEKTLVYFPTVRTLNMFNSHLRQNYASVAEKTALYYGSLDKHEKKESLKEFKDGDAKVMLGREFERWDGNRHTRHPQCVSLCTYRKCHRLHSRNW